MAARLPVNGRSAGNLPHLARHGVAAYCAEDSPTWDEAAHMLFPELRAVLA